MNMHGFPLLSIFGLVLVFNFTVPASPQIRRCPANAGFLLKTCSYLVFLTLSISTTSSPSNFTAVNHASRKKILRYCSGTCARCMVARPLQLMLLIAISAKWFCWGVSLAVYSNAMLSFHAALFALACKPLFLPALLHRMMSIPNPCCFHHDNCSQSGSIIPFLV